MAFQREMPIDKIKKLIASKKQIRQREEWKNKDQVECWPSQRHKQSV
jgi:hypothetical protein